VRASGLRLPWAFVLAPLWSPVGINQRGPFDFMVDTGSQVTVIDPSLAAQLELKPQGEVPPCLHCG
jgi:hypothetical protein